MYEFQTKAQNPVYFFFLSELSPFMKVNKVKLTLIVFSSKYIKYLWFIKEKQTNMLQQNLTNFSPFSCRCSFNEPIMNVQLAGSIHIHSKQSRSWLVGCFGFNGPLRQYFSLYRAVSQRAGERGARIDGNNNNKRALRAGERGAMIDWNNKRALRP